jgi:hypothetical protein
MTRQVRLSAIERKAKILLEKEGYAVTPMRQCFITRYKPVNLMARRNRREMLYLKLKKTGHLLKEGVEVAAFCKDDIILIRRLFPVRTGPVDLHFGIWILLGSGFKCYEISGEELQSVSPGWDKSPVPCNSSPPITGAQGRTKGYGKGTGRQSPVQLLKTCGDMNWPLTGTGGLQP